MSQHIIFQKSEAVDTDIGVADFSQWQAMNIDNITPFFVNVMKKQIGKLQPIIYSIMTQILKDMVPQRTGKLLDTLIANLTVEINGFTIEINSRPPVGYPLVITNPQHFGAVVYGYGKYNKINPSLASVKIRETPKGAYYVVTDSSAVGPYMELFNTYIIPIVIDLVDGIANSINFEVRVPITIPKKKSIAPMFAPFEGAAKQTFPVSTSYGRFGGETHASIQSQATLAWYGGSAGQPVGEAQYGPIMVTPWGMPSDVEQHLANYEALYDRYGVDHKWVEVRIRDISDLITTAEEVGEKIRRALAKLKKLGFGK